MKIKTLIFTGIGIVLFGGTAYATKDLILGTELTPLGAAEFISSEALMTAYISTDQERWMQLEGLNIPSSILNNSWQKTQQELFANTTISYSQDIQPWLGNIALAIVPSNNPQASSEPEFLGIIGIKNKLKAYQFLQKIAQETKSIEEQRYRGVKIIEQPDESVYLATMGDRVLLSDRLAVIKQGIDTYKGSPSLADHEPSQAAFTANLDLQNPLGQIYLTNYSGLINSAQSQETNSQIGELPIFDEVEYLVLGLGTQGQSLQGRSLSKLSSGRMTQGFTPSSGKLLDRLPENSITVLNGSNINQIWTNTTAILAEDPNLDGSLKMMRGGLKMTTGLDLERDIFNWMDGEYTFALIPTKTAIIPQLGFGLGGVFLWETQQQKLAQQSLVKLENLWQSDTGLTPTQIQMRNKTMTQWHEPLTGFTLTYGWLDDQSLMLAVGDQVAELIDTKSFKNSEHFKSLAQQLPQNNLGYTYLDMKPIANLINNLAKVQPSLVPPETMALINSVDSVVATTTIPNSTTIQGDLAIRFKPHTK